MTVPTFKIKDPTEMPSQVEREHYLINFNHLSQETLNKINIKLEQNV